VIGLRRPPRMPFTSEGLAAPEVHDAGENGEDTEA
jgi:hypothetical protein